MTFEPLTGEIVLPARDQSCRPGRILLVLPDRSPANAAFRRRRAPLSSTAGCRLTAGPARSNANRRRLANRPTRERSIMKFCYRLGLFRRSLQAVLLVLILAVHTSAQQPRGAT